MNERSCHQAIGWRATEEDAWCPTLAPAFTCIDTHTHIRVTHTQTHTQRSLERHIVLREAQLCATYFLEFISSQSKALVPGQKHSKSLINIFALNKKRQKSKTWIPSSPVRSAHPRAKRQGHFEIRKCRRDEPIRPAWLTHCLWLIKYWRSSWDRRAHVTHGDWEYMRCMSHGPLHTELSPCQPLAPPRGTRRACYKPADTKPGGVFFLMPQTLLCQQPIILIQQNAHTSLWTRLGL